MDGEDLFMTLGSATGLYKGQNAVSIFGRLWKRLFGQAPGAVDGCGNEGLSIQCAGFALVSLWESHTPPNRFGFGLKPWGHPFHEIACRP